MTATTTDQVAVDLYTAAEVLRTRGWATGQLESRDGRVCLEGAIRIAAAGHNGRGRSDIEPALFRTRINPAVGAVERHLRDNGLASSAVNWNDRHAESGDEVAELLERVAAERAGEDR